MMQKSFFYFLLFALSTAFHTHPFELKTRSKSVVLIDAESGKILYEKNAHSLLPPASTTKIATAAYVLSKLNETNLDDLIEANPEALSMASKSYKKKMAYSCRPYLLEPDGTSLDIIKFEKLSYRVLLHGLMMASANDAANVLAYHVGNKKIETFMDQMNVYLKKIGCSKTQFFNPHGLHHPQHLTTSYELALIAIEAKKNKLFCDIVKTLTYTRPKTNKSEERNFSQHNRLMIEGDFYYPLATGIKTGYTEDANYCLVASAENGKRSLIAVVLGSPTPQERYSDVIELFNQAFEEVPINHKVYDCQNTTFQFFHPDARKIVNLKLSEDIQLKYYSSTKPIISSKISFSNSKPPFFIGQNLGELAIILDNDVVLTQRLFAIEDVPLKRSLEILKRVKGNFLLIIFVFFSINFFLYVAIKKRKDLISIFLR